MKLNFDIYIAPPTIAQIEEWRESSQQKHKASARRYRRGRILTGVLVVGCIFAFCYFVNNFDNQKRPFMEYLQTISWEFGSLLTAPFLSVFIMREIVAWLQYNATKLEPLLESLADIGPSTMCVSLFYPPPTVKDLISWSEQFPEVKNYIGEVNRMGRLLTNFESQGIGVWVRDKIKERSESKRKESGGDVLKELTKVGVSVGPPRIAA